MSAKPEIIDTSVRRDDLFTRHGITWQRCWQGDNSGMYVWRSTDGRLEAWRCDWQRVERVDADGVIQSDVIPDYRATLDGVLVGQSHRLRDVMDRAALAWMSRKAAA